MDSVFEGQPAAKRNRLQFETSPYLLQHATNPVDWFPWGGEAFDKAKREDKPIFLSIGYSSCHWCHVMEVESFQDDTVAALLNDSYVSIKVDREERPDIDQVYMMMAQLVTGQGGWPLTGILAPDGKPFFLGTYLPRESSAGHMGLLQLLPYVTDYWAQPSKREELLRSGNQIVQAATQALVTPTGSGFPTDARSKAVADLKRAFDHTYGGFGVAPKFPMPTRLSFLLMQWWDSHDPEVLAMVQHTLKAMRHGGIYDHLASGFHRYSVDERWAVPHFEKMLYDQALLADVYLDAFLATADVVYAQTSRDVLEYVLRRLTGPEGGFYCGEDADSERVEGAYYLWSLRELRQLLNADELDILRVSMGIGSGQQRAGRSNEPSEYEKLTLALINPPEVVAQQLHLPPGEVERLLSSARTKLLEARAQREPVSVDRKVSADWNGLVIAALARAGRVLNRSDFVSAASRAADFVMEGMRRTDGVLMHSWKNGRTSAPGFLEDYAFVAHGLLELFQSTQDVRHLRWSLQLAERILGSFRDEASGDFFQVGVEGEQLLVPVKPLFDGALPSGNSVAGMVLVRLARLTERSDLREAADRLFSALGTTVCRSPSQFPGILMAYMLHSGNTRVTVVAGERGAQDTRDLLQQAATTYAPDNLLVFLPVIEMESEVAALAPVAGGHDLVEGRAAAYVCDRTTCAPPATQPKALSASLAGKATLNE